MWSSEGGRFRVLNTNLVQFQWLTACRLATMLCETQVLRPMLTPTPSGMQAVGSGVVTCSITEGIATVSFYHPKSNSLPAALLNDIAGRITSVSKHPATRVVVIRSEGAGTFCAGASFDELKQIDTPEAGKEFFMGFARVILPTRRRRKPLICRVQGKGVGGGVGIVAASASALAVPAAPA